MSLIKRAFEFSKANGFFPEDMTDKDYFFYDGERGRRVLVLGYFGTGEQDENRFCNRLKELNLQLKPHTIEVLVESRKGLSKGFLQVLEDHKAVLMTPLQFFDVEFKFDSTRQYQGYLKDVFSGNTGVKSIAQPFRDIKDGREGDDLFEELKSAIKKPGPGLIFVSGRAGMGKSVLFNRLCKVLYDGFQEDKRGQEVTARRPIPFTPAAQFQGINSIDTVLHTLTETEIPRALKREALEWLLKNGYATWLFDGFDEMCTSDPDFLQNIASLVENSQAKVLIFFRDNITLSAQYVEFSTELAGMIPILRYELRDWGAKQYKQFVDEYGAPASTKNEFLELADRANGLFSLPFYCKVVWDEINGRGAADPDRLNLDSKSEFVISLLRRKLRREQMKRFLPNAGGQEDAINQIEALIGALAYLALDNYSPLETSGDSAEVWDSGWTPEKAADYLEAALTEEMRDMDADAKARVIDALKNCGVFRVTSGGLLAFEHEVFHDALAAREFDGNAFLFPVSPEQLKKLPKKVLAEGCPFIEYLNEFAGSNGGRRDSVIRNLRNGFNQVAAQDRASMQISIAYGLIAGLSAEDKSMAEMVCKDMKLEGLVLRGKNLKGANFSNATLKKVTFESCNLEGAKFNGAVLSKINLSNNRLNAASFHAIRMDTISIEGDLYTDRTEALEKLNELTGLDEARDQSDNCGAADALLTLLSKYINKDGTPRRSWQSMNALMRGHWKNEWPHAEDIIKTSVRQGGLKIEHGGRYARPGGVSYRHMVEFVKTERAPEDSWIARVLKATCPVQACTHFKA